MPDVRLFSYGTLRQPEVQLATFGRRLDGHPDAVTGYRVDTVTITDPGVVATSGSDRHPVLVAAGDPGAAVEGTVLAITARELVAADAYEVDAYERVEVPLRLHNAGADPWLKSPKARSARKNRGKVSR